MFVLPLLTQSRTADWAIYMVTAAVQFSSSNSDDSINPRRLTYITSSAACLAILNTLNWHEAHDEYIWPDFSALGFDFPQAMRLRRALVGDVLGALRSAGRIDVGDEVIVLGTPDSSMTRAEKRSTGEYGGGIRGELC